MNFEWNFIVFLGVYIFCVSIKSEVIEADSEKIDQVIKVEYGGNVTLLCNPLLRDNLTLSSLASDFKWVFNNYIPVYTKGKFTSLIFEFDADNSSLAIDTNPPGTLILHDNPIFSNNSTLKCTFSTPLGKLSYTYLLQIKRERHSSVNYYYEFKNEGDCVVLPCGSRDTSIPVPTDIKYYWLSRKQMPNNRPEVEIISKNRNIVLKNNSNGFQVAEDGSLIISSLPPAWKTSIECHTPSGIFATRYSTNRNKNYESDSEYSWNKKDIAVEQGNDVSLKCPVGNASFLWIRNTTEVLFVNGRAFKNRKTDNLKIDYEKRLLNITNFSPSLSGNYTCSATNGKTYQYIVTESIDSKTKREEQAYTVFNGADILGKNISLHCPSSSTSDPYVVWTRNYQNNVEVLFINGQSVEGNENDKLKTANNGSSLLISDFYYTLGGVYVCSLDTGINSTFHIIVPDEFKDWPITNFKTRNFSVNYGTTNLVLPCPSMYKNTNSSYQWFVSLSPYGDGESILLFFNQERFGYDAMLASHFYEINDDGSLVILAVKLLQYGEYTCQRITGEKYVYNLNRKRRWINETISIKSDMSNITLPCTVDNPRDAYDRRVFWALNLPSVNFWRSFEFLNGKIRPKPLPLKSELPENFKLAADRRSLIVSNLTSMNPVKDEYICSFMYSDTTYRYLLTY